jgi:hypothetical protein
MDLRRNRRWKLGPHLFRRSALSPEEHEELLRRARAARATQTATLTNLRAALAAVPESLPEGAFSADQRQTLEAFRGMMKKSLSLLEEIGGYLDALSGRDPRPSDFKRLGFLEVRLAEAYELAASRIAQLASFNAGPRD